MPLVGVARELALETRNGNPIANSSIRLPPDDGTQIAINDHIARFRNTRPRTRKPSPTYNCHGLTFGGRRTNITDQAAIARILEEDDYERILSVNDVMAGDIIIYKAPLSRGGEREHSGIVVDVKREDGLLVPIPMVVSKWGDLHEVIHAFNDCPFDSTNVEYYRVVE